MYKKHLAVFINTLCVHTTNWTQTVKSEEGVNAIYLVFLADNDSVRRLSFCTVAEGCFGIFHVLLACADCGWSVRGEKTWWWFDCASARQPGTVCLRCYSDCVLWWCECGRGQVESVSWLQNTVTEQQRWSSVTRALDETTRNWWVTSREVHFISCRRRGSEVWKGRSSLRFGPTVTFIKMSSAAVWNGCPSADNVPDSRSSCTNALSCRRSWCASDWREAY